MGNKSNNKTNGLDSRINEMYQKLPPEIQKVYAILKPLLGPDADVTIEEYTNLLLRAYALDLLKNRDGSDRNSYVYQMGKELFTDYLKTEAEWKDNRIETYFTNTEGGK